MKNLMMGLSLIVAGFSSRAQSFFYIENNPVTEKSIREQLIKASQYVTHSPLSSDYIIQTDAHVESGSGVLNLKMTVQDSVTLKTIFLSKEAYTLSSVNVHTRLFFRMTIASFIEKNIQQLIDCTREDRYDQRTKFLKERKDKT